MGCAESGRQPPQHGIDFADVTAVFEDERALTVRDEIKAVNETRMLMVGREHDGAGNSQRASAVPEVSSMKTLRRGVDFSRGRRGAVLPPAKGKTRITIRLDTDVLSWFREEVNRAGGGNYQTLMNWRCGGSRGKAREPRDTLRRVLREELGRQRGSRS